MKTKEIEEYVKKWMSGYEPDTFISNEHGAYIYKSGASGINIVCFFEDLLKDYIEDTDLTNAKLVDENERYEENYTTVVNDNVLLRTELDEVNKDLDETFHKLENCIDYNKKLQSELSAAKERVKELEKNARQLCTLLAKDKILFFLSQGEKDGIMNILKTLNP